MRSTLASLLLLGCSSVVDIDHGRQPNFINVCGEMGDAVAFAVSYWTSNGHDVAINAHKSCTVFVDAAEEPLEQPWKDAVSIALVYVDDNKRVVVNPDRPAFIRFREPYWSTHNTGWHYTLAAHELGHVLGVPHSNEMPMLERLGSEAIEEWLGSAQ